MNTCIRCGLQVTWDQTSHMFLTQDGAYSCGASLPGEAGIHRVDSRPPQRPRPKASFGRALAQVGLGWAAGRIAADVLFSSGGARKNEEDALRMMAAVNPEGAADLRARMSGF